MIDRNPLYLNIDLVITRKYKLNVYESIVLSYLNYKLNPKGIITIDNESIVLELSNAGIEFSLSTIKRAIKVLKSHNLIKVKTSYIPELNKNKREIAKVLIEPLVVPVKSKIEFQKHYKYNKKTGNIAKVPKEPTINNNINNIKTNKNNDKNPEKTYFIKVKNGYYESLVPVSLEIYNNTSPELRYN